MSSVRTPRHRRPSFMKDPETYRIHMEADFERMASPDDTSPGCDGYSYRAEHYPQWALDESLGRHLPAHLVERITDWACAGAAVKTSLERLTLLDHEAMDRGYPEKRSGRLSRTASSGHNTMCSPTPPSSTSTPGGSFSFPLETRWPRIPSQLNDVKEGEVSTDRTPYTTTALESPPWSSPESVPVSARPGSANSFIDPLKLNERLSRFEVTRVNATPSATSPPLTPSTSNTTGPPFDLNAWERFLEQYRREVDNVKEDDIVRFRHLRRKVTMDYYCILDEDRNAIDPVIQKKFLTWWAIMDKAQDALEVEVSRVRMPTLDEIQHLRRIYGLNV